MLPVSLFFHSRVCYSTSDTTYLMVLMLRGTSWKMIHRLRDREEEFCQGVAGGRARISVGLWPGSGMAVGRAKLCK